MWFTRPHFLTPFPSPAPDGVLPVMIWIHGGGNVNGSTSEPVPFVNTGAFYSGQFLAGNHNVAVVSMNYRLLDLFGTEFERLAIVAGYLTDSLFILATFALVFTIHDKGFEFGDKPCFVDQLFPQTAFNMVKVLEKATCDVQYNTNQTCCGQPSFNAGFWEDAKEVASKFIKDFEGTDYIVAPSASCVG